MSISRTLLGLGALMSIACGSGSPPKASSSGAPAASTPQAIATHGGVPLSEAEIQANALTIYPDGRGLPEGSGTAAQGEALYKAQCAACHGLEGGGGMGTRLVGREGYPEGSKDVLAATSRGAWPTSVTIFDFVRRAMPHVTPKSLTDDQVYQLTAWILERNGLIDADTVIDANTLPTIERPTHELTVNIYAQEGAP